MGWFLVRIRGDIHKIPSTVAGMKQKLSKQVSLLREFWQGLLGKKRLSDFPSQRQQTGLYWPCLASLSWVSTLHSCRQLAFPSGALPPLLEPLLEPQEGAAALLIPYALGGGYGLHSPWPSLHIQVLYFPEPQSQTQGEAQAFV